MAGINYRHKYKSNSIGGFGKRILHRLEPIIVDNNINDNIEDNNDNNDNDTNDKDSTIMEIDICEFKNDNENETSDNEKMESEPPNKKLKINQIGYGKKKIR